MSDEVLYPGDFIANAEEFLPGEGTYLDDGKIFSAEVGHAKKDLEKRVVAVEPSNGKIALMQRRGLEAVGVIARASDKAAFVDLITVRDGGKRYIPIPASTVLRVSDIRNGFVKSLKDEFKVGDIVRVKIVEAEPHNVIVTTDGPNLGVIKAFCAKCRYPLDQGGKDLVCSSCGWKDHRHLAGNYRQGKV